MGKRSEFSDSGLLLHSSSQTASNRFISHTSFVPELHAFGDRAPAKDRRMAAIFKRVFFIAPALNEPIIFFSAASIRFQQDCPIVSLDAALHATGCF